MPTVTSKPFVEIISAISHTPPASVSGMSDHALLAEIKNDLTVLKEVTTQEIEFLLQPFSLSTGKQASTPQALIPESFRTSHFIIANTGAAKSGNLYIGGQTLQVIPIAPGALFLYSFSLVNYVVDLANIWINSPSSNQPYAVLAFYPK